MSARRSFALALSCLCIAGAASAQKWHPEFEEARAAARSENRVLVVDFWADWCGPCHAMDDQAWGDPTVRGLSERFVLARVDFGPHGNSTSEYYDVHAIPTVLVLDRKGACITRVQGFRSPTALQELLRQLPARATELDSLVALAAAPVPGFDSCLALASRLNARQLFEPSARLCKQARRMLAASHADSLDERLDLLEAQNWIPGDPGKGMGALHACFERYPRGRYRLEQHATLVRALAGFGAQAQADTALAKMREEFPTDSLTQRMERLVASRR